MMLLGTLPSLLALGLAFSTLATDPQCEADVEDCGLLQVPWSESRLQPVNLFGTTYSSCNEMCSSQGFGNGKVLGTPFFCAASCAECSGKCFQVNMASGLSDYGVGCWSGDKVCCCDHMGLQSAARADQDKLTVMNYNTYLLQVVVLRPVSSKPNMDERQAGITKWFNTLNDDAVPDVLVFNEIMSAAGESMMRGICSSSWSKNGEDNVFIPCTNAGTRFAFATPAVNPTSSASFMKCGGVVVLVKKGLQMTKADDQIYSSKSFGERFAQKGFWAVQLKKGTQEYWVFGTHTQAYEGDSNVKIRQAQFKQLREYIDANVPDGARVVIAGDMNVMTGPYKDKNGNTVNAVETDGMMKTLGGNSAPAWGGTLVPKGFWLPLQTPLDVSCDIELNPFVKYVPDEYRLGNQQYDWVITPGKGDRLASPQTFRYQIAPLKADECYLHEDQAGKKADDLSDHYGVFAELCYDTSTPEKCPPTAAVQGHRGASGILPHGPDCTPAAIDPIR